MRVLLVCHQYPPDGVTGVERCTQMLASELAKAGDVVTVVTRRPAPVSQSLKLLRERSPDGVQIYRFFGGEAELDHHLNHHEGLEQLFETILVEAAPDVVHVHHLRGLSPRFVHLAHRYGAAVVLSLHDFHFACPLVHLQKPSGELCSGTDIGCNCASECFAHEGRTGFLKWGVRATYFCRLLTVAERIICPSQFVASYFERHGADPALTKVVPNGIFVEDMFSAQSARATPKQRGKLNIAFFGSVVPHKGVHVILDALNIADLGSVDLQALGQVPYLDYALALRERASSISGLTLRLCGPYELVELSHRLADVDCAITPSLVPESFSITTREALVRGIPVIVNRLGALSEAVVEGENGFAFDANHPEELAAILRRLVEEEDLLPRLRAGALKSKVLTPHEHMSAVRAIYEDALVDFGRPFVSSCSDA